MARLAIYGEAQRQHRSPLHTRTIGGTIDSSGTGHPDIFQRRNARRVNRRRHDVDAHRQQRRRMPSHYPRCRRRRHDDARKDRHWDWILAGNNTYIGNTTVSGGILQVGNGSTTGAIAGNVALLASTSLAFNLSSSYTFNGLISGAGSITQNGSGTVNHKLVDLIQRRHHH